MICLFFTGFYCEGQTITPAVCIAGYYCLEGTQSEKQFPCPEGTYNPDQGKPTIDDIQWLQSCYSRCILMKIYFFINLKNSTFHFLYTCRPSEHLKLLTLFSWFLLPRRWKNWHHRKMQWRVLLHKQCKNSNTNCTGTRRHSTRSH